MQDIIEQVLSYLRGIWRYRWWALAVAWVVCISGWVVVTQIPNEYQASAKLYVDTRSILKEVVQGIAPQLGNPDEEVELMTRTLFTRPNLEKVLLDTDLDLRARSDGEREAYINRIRSRARLSSARRENIFTISYEDQDPALARDVVQSLVNIWIENTLGGSRDDFTEARDFLENQIDDYKARLEEAEDRLKEFRRLNQGLMPGSGGSYYQRVEQAVTDLETARLQLRQATNRRDALGRQLGGEEPTFGLDTAAPPPPALSVTNDLVQLPIQTRIETLRQQLDLLLLQYTDKFPDVVYTREMIAMLERERDEQLAELKRSQITPPSIIQSNNPDPDANPVYQQLKVAMANEEAQIAELEALVEDRDRELQSLREKLDQIPEIEAQLVALNRDYESTKGYYDQLVARKEATDIGEAAKEGSDIRFDIVDPPRLPTEPAGPNRPVLTSGVLMAGVGAGVGLAFLLSQLRLVVDSRRILVNITGRPVLGAVSDVKSVAALRWERLWILFYFFVGGLLLMVYAGLIIWQVTGGISLPLGQLPFL